MESATSPARTTRFYPMSTKPLNVGQILRILAKEDPKKLLILASRKTPKAEPTFTTVHSVSASLVYDPKHHDVGLSELTPTAVRLGHTEDDVISRGKPAVILFP